MFNNYSNFLRVFIYNVCDKRTDKIGRRTAVSDGKAE